jgi:hypothetical protein
MDDTEKRAKGYLQHEDGYWYPSPERLAEIIRLVNEGDEEYMSTLVKVDWNTD